MMQDRRLRGGFSLVELMIASSLLAIVIGGVFSALIGGQRLLRMTLTQTEFALRARELRDKLLFHAAPVHDSTVWAGLLSGTNNASVVEGNAEKILMRCSALKSSGKKYSGNRADQMIQLILADSGQKTCRFFSEDRYDERWDTRWLHPGRLNLFADCARTSPIDASVLVTDNRFFINITARETIGGSTVEHNERVVVPVFGKSQRTESDRTGGLQ